jgi:hypothetical protein
MLLTKEDLPEDDRQCELLVAFLMTFVLVRLPILFSDVAIYNHDTEDDNTKARMQWDMVKKEQGIKRLYVRFERE